MTQFYFQLWFAWALRVTLSSVLLAAIFALLITFGLYIKQGVPAFDARTMQALVQIFLFWFPLVWSITLLLSLFRSLKYIFNKCLGGYTLKLLECNKVDVIEVIGYGDLVKVWRRWFMLMIWLSATQMVFSLGVSYLLGWSDSVFQWFSIYVLFVFILISGYISFILLGGRCKKVKLIQC